MLQEFQTVSQASKCTQLWNYTHDCDARIQPLSRHSLSAESSRGQARDTQFMAHGSWFMVHRRVRCKVVA